MANTLLVVTGNPSSYTSGNWPETAMNHATWRFSFTTTGTSGSGTYSTFHSFFDGPVIGGTSGGLWIVDDRLELYQCDDDALVFSHAMTFSASQVLTFKINVVAKTVTISGATTGNGTFSFSLGGPYFFAGTTLTAGGVTGDPGFTITGTFSNIDDAFNGVTASSGTFALTGSAVTLRVARKTPAASGTFVLTGSSATLTLGASAHTLTASSGTFALAGTSAGLRADRRTAAGSGSFAFTGTSAALLKAHPMTASSGTFALTGSSVTLRRALRLSAAGGSISLTGSAAALLVGGVIAIGDHGVDAQPFPFSNRNALITLNTQASGSVVLLASGGRSSDVTQSWTDNKSNTIRKLTTVQDYPDFGGYGTQVGVTRNAMAGGSSHQFMIPVGNDDEDTSFAVEIKGGRRTTFLNTNVADTGAGTTQAIGPISTDGPAALIAFWWGASPVSPPFSGTSGPGGSGVGTPFTAVPDSGFSVLESYLFNFEAGEVQAAMAAKVVDTAGSYSVTWTHSPAQGAQLWLVAVQPAAAVASGPGTFVLAGSAATLTTVRHLSMTATSGTFALSGSAVALLNGHTLVVASGTFALTGSAATLRQAHVMAAAAGSFVLAGSAVSLGSSHAMTAAGGTFAVSGSAATLLERHALAAAAGAVTLTGSAAALLASRTMAAAAGSIVLTGSTVGLTTQHRIAATGGVYTLSGSPAGLAAQRRLSAGPGTFALAGSAAGLRRSLVVAAAPGAYALTGQDAALLKQGQRAVLAASGTFVLTGGVAALSTIMVASSGAFAVSGSVAALRSNRRVTAASGSFAIAGGDATLNRTTTFRLSAALGAYLWTGSTAALSSSEFIAPHHVRITGVSPDPEVYDGHVPSPEIL
jgi:hypothetical protein